jgi:hypothetical protein
MLGEVDVVTAFWGSANVVPWFDFTGVAAYMVRRDSRLYLLAFPLLHVPGEPFNPPRRIQLVDTRSHPSTLPIFQPSRLAGIDDEDEHEHEAPDDEFRPKSGVYAKRRRASSKDGRADSLPSLRILHKTNAH